MGLRVSSSMYGTYQYLEKNKLKYIIFTDATREHIRVNGLAAEIGPCRQCCCNYRNSLQMSLHALKQNNLLKYKRDILFYFVHLFDLIRQLLLVHASL